MENTPAKKRIGYYDIAKGIGILLVVWAHAKAPGTNPIYQFHMPLFFLISGLLYSDKAKLKDYVVRKIQSLYIPFAFWNLLFYIAYSIYCKIDATTILQKSGLILLTLEKDGAFLGATWFLGALFLVSIVYKIIDTLIKESKAKDAVMLAIFGGLMVLGFAVDLPYMQSRVLILSFYFAVGAFFKKHKEQIRILEPKLFFLPILCFAGFVLISMNNSANMGKNVYTYPALFALGAFLMSYALIYLCKMMDSCKAKLLAPVNRFLTYLGKNSIDIVIWQFVFFRVGVFINMAIAGEKLGFKNVMHYYPMFDESWPWWVMYLLLGLLMPLLVGKILRIGPWGKLFKKMHIV